MNLKEIKQEFKKQFDVEFGYYNDLNKKTNIRRVKLTWVGKAGVDNLLHTRRDEFYKYFKDVLQLDCEKYTWDGLCGCETIVLRLKK